MPATVRPQGDPPVVVSGRRLPRGVREFLATEVAGGVVLLTATVVALAWANSPWDASYESLWTTELTLRLGDAVVSEDLRHWVDEALMTLFFFVVGLEIKRELVTGELRDPRIAITPAVAALGGMVVPALLFLAFNAGDPGGRGWGIPMATDIAFTLGVLALLGKRCPPPLKLFLLTLAIVDDVGAILVIAVFYSEGVELPGLLLAIAVLAAMGLLRRAGVLWLPVYLVLGAVVWGATYASGVHATIAGALLGLLAPARPLAPAAVVREWAADLEDEPSPEQLSAMTTVAKASVSVAERLEHQLHPVTSFVVIPLFALANAGVRLDAGSLDAPGAGGVVAGVVVGLVVGKALGITAFTWVAARFGFGTLPAGVSWRHLTGAAAVAGVGFTVSLFVAGLAYGGAGSSELEAAAKIGILGASALAAVLGSAVLVWASRSA